MWECKITIAQFHGDHKQDEITSPLRCYSKFGSGGNRRLPWQCQDCLDGWKGDDGGGAKCQDFQKVVDVEEEETVVVVVVVVVMVLIGLSSWTTQPKTGVEASIDCGITQRF